MEIWNATLPLPMYSDGNLFFQCVSRKSTDNTKSHVLKKAGKWKKKNEKTITHMKPGNSASNKVGKKYAKTGGDRIQ